MAGMQSGDDDIIAGINVTPLVDIVLVILIVFIVTTSYIVRSQLNVDLPKAASGASETHKTLVFQVTEDGSYLLDDKQISIKKIGSTIESELDENPNLRAVIAADKDVRYGRVIDLIDTMKLNGLDKFALNIERKAGQSGGKQPNKNQ